MTNNQVDHAVAVRARLPLNFNAVSRREEHAAAENRATSSTLKTAPRADCENREKKTDKPTDGVRALTPKRRFFEAIAARHVQAQAIERVVDS